MRILITSAGRRAELLQCFRTDAAALGIDLTILACDLNPDWSVACQLADKHFPVPPVTDPAYVDTLIELCRVHQVSLVIPTIDPELLPLSRARHRFAEIGTRIAVSGPATVEIARDKYETAAFFSMNGIAAPRSAFPETIMAAPQDWTWPLLVKANHGSASRGLAIARSPEELNAAIADEPMIVQELLHGREFTVNMFFDRNGTLCTAIPHERVQTRAGEVEKGVTCRLPVLVDMARQIAAALPEPRGALCFQAMVAPDGSASAFEINARFGGGYPLAHRAGATFSRWLLEEQFGLPCSAHNDWQEGVRMLRYDAAVFATP